MEMYKKRVISMALCLVMVIAVFAPMSAYAWHTTGADTPTHAFIVDQAIKILEGDLGTSITYDANFKILKNNIAKLKEGSLAPDNLSNVALGGLSEGDWWSSHFYDPDTEKSYSTNVPKIHAEYQTRRYLGMAVAEWKKGSYQQAAYYLGYAAHFFTDLCNPHHGANNTALNSPYNHGEFETYVQERHSSYAVSSLGTRTKAASDFFAETLNNYNNINEFVYKSAKVYAKEAKNLFYQYCNSESKTNWNLAAEPTMINSQKGLALLIYRFVQELKLTQKLTVTVETSNDWFSGTDNDIYFGFKTSNGLVYEYLMDVKNDILDGTYAINTYNDFEMGDVDSYSFYIYDKRLNLANVTDVWVKKVHSIVDDNWRCATVDISVDGKVVNSVAPNVWLTAAKPTFSWKVNGLVPTDEEAIGSFSVRIKTSSDLWSGTDNNVFFGMELYDGRKVEYLCDKDWYNDFEAGDDDTYTFKINDPTFRAYQISKLWLRKDKEYVGDDGWKPSYIEITMKGISVYSTTLNKWLENSYQQHTMTVSGLNCEPYILKDTGFEAQLNNSLSIPWVFEGTASKGISKGTGSAHTDSNNAWIRTSDSSWSALKQSVTVTANTNYVLSGWIKTSSNVTSGYFGVRNSNGTVLKEVKYGKLGEYTKLTISFNSGSNTSVTIFGGFWGAGSDSWVNIDSLTFLKPLQ